MQGEKLQTCKNLAEALASAGISRAELSKRAEITEASISRYLTGKAEPRSAELFRLAKVLGTSMEFLLSGEAVAAKGTKVRNTEDVVPYVTKRKPPVHLPDPAELDLAIRAVEAHLKTLQRFRASFDAPENVMPFPSGKDTTTELPFYGWVAAGKPANVDYYSDETLTVPGDFGRKPHFLLRVRGRSMEPDFPEGSYVVVRALAQGEYPKKGDVVIAADGNGPAMKRLEYRKEGTKGNTPRKPTPHLVSINPAFPDVVPIGDTPIQGVVVESVPAEDFDL